MAISDLVATNVVSFIDYALVIVVIMTIWYGVKFFMVEGPSKEERQAEREKQGTAIRDWFKDKKEKAKTEAERKKEEKEKKKKIFEEEAQKKRKKDLVKPAQANLIRAVEAVNAISDVLDEIRVKAAIPAHCNELLKLFKTFNEELEQAWENLKLAKKKVEEKERGLLTQIQTKIEVVQKRYKNDLEGRIPPMSATFHKDITKKGIPKHIANIRGEMNIIWNGLEKFYE